jgi:hypothetical protein
VKGKVMDMNAEHLMRNDPIMQELWAAKAAINKEANYSIDEIVRRIREKYPPGSIGLGSQPQSKSIENPTK